jgi:hypothetical protein
MLFAEPRHPCHTAFYEVDERGREWIIHAWAVARKVVRTAMTPERWDNSRLRYVFRFAGA